MPWRFSLLFIQIESHTPSIIHSLLCTLLNFLIEDKLSAGGQTLHHSAPDSFSFFTQSPDPDARATGTNWPGPVRGHEPGFSASLVGKEMVDYICQYLSSVQERRVTPDVRPGYLRAQLPESAPEEPDSWDSIFGDIERIIMPGVRRSHHRVILDVGV